MWQCSTVFLVSFEICLNHQRCFSSEKVYHITTFTKGEWAPGPCVFTEFIKNLFQFFFLSSFQTFHPECSEATPPSCTALMTGTQRYELLMVFCCYCFICENSPSEESDKNVSKIALFYSAVRTTSWRTAKKYIYPLGGGGFHFPREWKKKRRWWRNLEAPSPSNMSHGLPSAIENRNYKKRNWQTAKKKKVTTYFTLLLSVYF